MSDEYEVGFGKPPEQTRFRKGVSGNPRGRPKGALNKKTILGRTLQEKVVITENGKRKRITKREALYKQIVNKGVSGDLKAAVEVIKLDSSPESQELDERTDTPLSESDQEVANQILERMRQCAREPKD
jgi:hypothetical protein